MATTREELHRLVDQLADSELEPVARVLRERGEARERVRSALRNAPIDDEPLTDEDIAALDQAEAELAAGLGIPNEQLASLGTRSDGPSRRRRRR